MLELNLSKTRERVGADICQISDKVQVKPVSVGGFKVKQCEGETISERALQKRGGIV